MSRASQELLTALALMTDTALVTARTSGLPLVIGPLPRRAGTGAVETILVSDDRRPIGSARRLSLAPLQKLNVHLKLLMFEQPL